MAELSKAFLEFVGPFSSYDINMGNDYDVTLKAGQIFAIRLLLQVARGGYLHFGTPCKSWVVLSRSYTERTS